MTADATMPVVDASSETPLLNGRYFRRQVIRAFEQGRSPDFSIGEPYQWIRAIDAMLNRGQIATARHSLQHLCDQQPELEWPRSVLALVDAMPDEPPGEPEFADDLRSDLQVVPRDGARTAVLVFCGRRNQPHMPLPMFQRWMARLGSSVVYLRDFADDHYLGGLASCGSVEATLEKLRGTIQDLEAERVFCLGNCSGGYAAARYGVDLGAERVFAFGSPVNMDPEFNTYLNRVRTAQRLAEAFPAAVLDLREVYLRAPRHPELVLFYGDKCWDDRIHSEHMAGIPGVRLEPMAGFDGHGVVPKLIRRGQFDAVLDRLIVPGEAE